MKTFQYVDQNNNVYQLTKQTLHYSPIELEDSSSGAYSGGEEALIFTTEELYTEVSELISNIINNENFLTDKRQKLTSMIYVMEDDERSSYILVKSKARTLLEEKLVEVKNE